MAIHIYADPDDAELLDSAVPPSEEGGEATSLSARAVSASSAAGGRAGGAASKALLDIHYHGKAGAGVLNPGRESAGGEEEPLPGFNVYYHEE